LLFTFVATSAQTCHSGRKEATILIMATGQRGDALVSSKHKNESLFKTLATNITEIQTLRGIVLLRGDFNARTIALLDTIDTNNLCELLQMPELVETKQPNVVAKQQNRDASVGG
jgi:hypothetical protein